MTAPVPTYNQQVVFGTRRVRGGCYRIPPVLKIRNAICFLFVYYAKRHHIELWALVIMSNHIHWVGLDHNGAFPDFLRDVNMRIQEVIADYHRIAGRLWSGDRPRTPRLVGTELETLLYVATNPVKHPIVDVSTNWPGLVFTPENAGDVITATCPEFLQTKYNSFPSSVTYVVPVPRFYGDMPITEVRRDFARRRRAKEAQLIAARQGTPALGAKRALEVGPHDRPDEPPSADDPYRCFHATPEREQECLNDLNEFRARYGAARRAFNDGRRDVVWPVGTYARHHWHRCPRASRDP